MYNRKISDINYKKKLSTLVFNLNNTENEELRSKVLSGEIIPEKLTKMTVDELAPSKLKKSRNLMQDKYLKEQVIRKDEIKIIAKNHKGEEIITLANFDNIETDQPNKNENIYNKALDQEENESENENSIDDAYMSHKVKKEINLEKTQSNISGNKHSKVLSNNGIVKTKTIVVSNDVKPSITHFSETNNIIKQEETEEIINKELKSTEQLQLFFSQTLSMLSQSTRDIIDQKRKEIKMI